jgi:hypothetical protein
VDGNIFYTGSTIQAGVISTAEVNVILTATEVWYNYGLNGTSHLALFSTCYLKGRINANGNFVLDNTSFTSFYTTDVPTTDDGFVYIEFLYVGSTTSRMYMKTSHPAFWFKDGKFRPYVQREVMPPKQKTVTVAVSSWQGSEAPFTATVNDADITDGCYVTANADIATQDVSDQAGIYSLISGGDGSFTLTARTIPKDSITIVYTILT